MESCHKDVIEIELVEQAILWDGPDVLDGPWSFIGSYFKKV